MTFLQTITLFSVTSTLLLAGPQQAKNEQLKSVVQMGNKSSKLLLQTLGKNMKKHMKKGGPMDALNFCAEEAYTLTEKVNKQLPKGVRVKRISANVRNPSNVASANELAVLNTFESMQSANVILPKHLIEQVNPTTYKYYKPLVIKKKVCLKCHGTLKDIELKRAINERYPLDNAKGYEMGDLRGAIVVTIDKSVK
jgi:hypothetical protein